MSVKTTIRPTSLIERYERHRQRHRSGGINETELRVEFIDPFFIAPDWDVRNESVQITINRPIAATNHQFDHVVYRRYDLTEEEIAIVEEGGGVSRERYNCRDRQMIPSMVIEYRN